MISDALDRARREARPRITWGDGPDQVRAHLLEEGYDADVVETALEEAAAERRTHFRGKGLRDLLYGFLCGAGLVLLFVLGSGGDGSRVGLKGGAGLVVALIGLPIGTLCFLIRGGVRLTRGGCGEREITDIEEPDE